MVRGSRYLIISLLALFGAPGALARNTSDDVLLAARALGFVRDLDSRAIRVAIIQDPSSNQSVTDSNEVKAAFGRARAAGISMTAIEVPLASIRSISNVDVIWVTRGLRDYSRLSDLPSQNHALSISNDFGCVSKGFCVLGVQSEPTVKIVLNADAAARSGISFEPAFRMMVTER